MELVEKKLRDVTNEEFKNWVGKNCLGIKCKDCIFAGVECNGYVDYNWLAYKGMFNNKFLDQTIKVEAQSILDEEEKRYLSGIIKPFRNQVRSIRKVISGCFENSAWIAIDIASKNPRPINLPYFNINTMYTGMEGEKVYTLKELGL